MTLVWLVTPTGALASTVAKTGPTSNILNITEDTQSTPPVNRIETNDITISLSGGNYTITDTVTITAGAGCNSVNANEVRCSAAGITRITVRAGDRDDEVRNTAPDPPGCGVFQQCATLEGGLGNDRLIGGPGKESLDGTDRRLANLGMDATDGNDVLDGGGRDDFFTGGPGSDTVTYENRTVPVSANLGACVNPPEQCLDRGPGAPEQLIATLPGGEIDAFNNDVGIENLIGGSANDTLVGSPEVNILMGGPGADSMSGDLQVDTVDYSERSSPVSVTIGNNGTFGRGDDGGAGEGDNVVGDVETVIAGSGNDTLVGRDPQFSTNPVINSAGENVLRGGDGDDTLDGRFGPDTLEGGGGTDTVTYADRSTAVTASIDGAADDGGGEDIDPVSLRHDNIGNDVENALGGSSDDTLTGSSAANDLSGGPGNDLLNGEDGDDALRGGSGDDTLRGAGGNDTELGEENNDVLVGHDGNDTLDGGPSEDRLNGGVGADTMSGGDGTDHVFYADRLNPVAASADGVGGDGELGEGDVIGGDVESLSGGGDNDVLVGNGGDGLIEGGGGDDTLDGGGGADTLLGLDGRDVAHYGGRAGAVTVDLGAPGGDGSPGENDDIRPDVEEVEGGAGNDTLIGDDSAKSLFGGAGNDFVDGRGGVDQVGGGPGNDDVEGGEGADVVKGDDGNDVLKGEFGDDILDAGAGDDILNGGAGVDTIAGGDGGDLVDYGAATKAVSVTLDGSANDGEGREGDFVRTDVESVTTGSSNDFINSRDGVAGRITCGRGTDRVAADTADRVAGDCEEKVEISARCTIARRAVKMSKSGSVKVRVTCPFEGRGRLTLSRGGRLGRKSFRITREGQSRTVKVKLSRKGRRSVRRKNRLRVTASVRLRRSDGVSASSRASRRITIRQ